jgi:hypothetical protein
MPLEQLRRTRPDAPPTDLWRWRWLVAHRALYDAVHQTSGALMLDHYLLTWTPDDLDLDTLHGRLERCFLSTATPCVLPPIWHHPVCERLQLLQPQQPGDPYLAVLMAYDVQGTWDLLSWQALLHLDLPLTLAIDIQTPPKDGLQGLNRKVPDAEETLAAVVDTRQSPDRRTRKAWEAAGLANEVLDRQSVHQVGYAVLVEAPTERALTTAIQTVDAALGMRLRLHACPGVQAEHLKLFTMLPRQAMHAPLPTRPTLSEGVAHKTPFGITRRASDSGTLWGTDLDTGLLLHHDLGLERKQNGHLLALGKPKYGKTTFFATQALRLAAEGTQVIWMEPANHAWLVRDAIGQVRACRYTDLAATPAINILDPISPSPAEQRDKIVRDLEIALGKLVMVGDWQIVRVRAFTNRERGLIDRAMHAPRMYGEHCHRLPTLTAADAPLLGDLVATLQTIGHDEDRYDALRLADEIATVLLGTAAAIYGRPTDVSTRFDADVTLYSFNGADPGVLPIIYDHLFSLIMRYMREPRQRGLVVMIDEAWFMTMIAALQDWLAAGIKTGRNFMTGLWLADQNAETFVGGHEIGGASNWGAFVTDNTAIRLFFRLDGAGADILERAYRGRLEPRHLQRIRTLGQGEYIGLFEDEVRHIRFDLLPLEAHSLTNR